MVSLLTPAAIARCATLFDAMGQKRFEIGSQQPMANLVKLTGNFLIASTLESWARRWRWCANREWTRTASSIS